jgi:hypothetical protein
VGQFDKRSRIAAVESATVPTKRSLSDGRQPGNNPERHKLSGQVLVNAATAEVGTSRHFSGYANQALTK